MAEDTRMEAEEEECAQLLPGGSGEMRRTGGFWGSVGCG